MIGFFRESAPSRVREADDVSSGEPVILEFRFNANLVRGMYHVECVVVDSPTQTILTSVSPLASFSVLESRTWAGVADLSVSAVARSERPLLVGAVVGSRS